ncbi:MULTISPECIES: adenylate/guanylate cyclase domain-containing protein [unclassified Shinella]|uniref:adenylate/guanylate cyclase domain-containing protein n=1 Tax=unclassified Shinella TaxID=2643062 RepID=UPI00234EA8A8|nr:MULTISPECIES: adenylate/guanylate cyclase domain-containing protein [unclassified Shinella]MCO5151501.1 adenylate/guanylate cyclase domain-containing protein [Shinella sp.]MDC7266108.1 adenylate/guanylate cyclase domain-containing protein [Shinella sp. HY16]MDC7273005.1 adenylate/guanylate cyclase domain-containing protein [Shinella sp. YZ44]
MDPQEIGNVVDWLVQRGLDGLDETELITAFCHRLGRLGIELEQAAIFIDTLHPVLESQGYFWDVADEASAARRDFSRLDAERNEPQWRASPFFHMLENELGELHINLTEKSNYTFPVLEDLRAEGHTDYFLQLHRLGEAIGEVDGLFSRWSTKRPGGFSAEDIACLRRTVPAFALAVKSTAFRRMTSALVEVYLGRDAARRVLKGRIERGKVDSIKAVLWFSDMRNYTALSESVHSGDLIAMLGDYAEAAISAVHAAGGDVLKLMGDGTLAIFNHADPQEAAAASLKAWYDLASRVEALNARRQEAGLATTTVHVGLHIGEVFYGNIGSNDRLDFTVIGPAVNEASRIVAASRKVGRQLLISNDLLSLLPVLEASAFEDLGAFRLKGVKRKKRLHAPRRP